MIQTHGRVPDHIIPFDSLALMAYKWLVLSGSVVHLRIHVPLICTGIPISRLSMDTSGFSVPQLLVVVCFKGLFWLSHQLQLLTYESHRTQKETYC